MHMYIVVHALPMGNLDMLQFIMPPTLKKLEGHIAFGLSVCVCVCVLTFEW